MLARLWCLLTHGKFHFVDWKLVHHSLIYFEGSERVNWPMTCLKCGERYGPRESS